MQNQSQPTFDIGVWDFEGSDPQTGSAMVFDALKEQYETPNGNGWRHELKIKESQRQAMNDTYENFTGTITAELSNGSKTIVAQHHAEDTGTIVKLYISDTNETELVDSEASNGIFDVYVRALETKTTVKVKDSSKSYLKFGNYLQAQDPETGKDHDDWAQFYDDANITKSIITFTNINHERKTN